ncbi:MAG: L-aspartate oxidase [Planctomycetaceae bacterium]|nr:L-aspartate oxidase [Planctomycetaceae bacterium]
MTDFKNPSGGREPDITGRLRYLVPFHPKRHPHFFTDILVIGGGLAGFQAALSVDPSLQVLVVCKDGLEQSNSCNAQGGIATVWDKDDRFARHVEDTLMAGGDLCDRKVVEWVVENGPPHIRKLLEIGVRFDQTAEGELLLSREGGHSHNRILHALGDATGREVMRGMIAEILKRPNIRVWEKTFALDLLTCENRCRGAIVSWTKQNERELIWAKQVILATGGIGQVYRETTNPDVATGDGIAMAYRAGAEIRDMEFIQFHPTVLYIAGSSRHLITEAMRGEGARLIDREGRRFMYDYDSRGELAPRDVVSSAIVRQMQKTNHPNVYLDISHKDSGWVYDRFPGITEVCRKFGIDIAQDKIPVRPGAHYCMGGITVDLHGKTTLPGLWAAGEVASTGLHGANRLASNSLLEAMVFGKSCGIHASEEAFPQKDDYRAEPIENKPVSGGDDVIDIADIRNSLKALLWRNAGVVRTGKTLQEALEDTERWSRYVWGRQFPSPPGWELQNMLFAARLILRNALRREESRGSHQRKDFPDASPDGGQTHWTSQRK